MEQYSDLPHDSYLKKKQVAQRFGVVQVGVSCFVPNHGLHRNYDVYVYNIWVRPVSLNEVLHLNNDEVSGLISFETKSINFLNKSSKLDWNKFLVEGVPYVSKGELNQLEEFQAEKIAEKTTSYNVKLDYMFSEDEEREKQKYLELIKDYVAKTTGNKEYTIENDLKPHVLKYLFDYCRINYWLRAYLVLPEDEFFDIEQGNLKLVVFENEEAFNDQLKRVKVGIENKITELAGFTRIFQNLLPSKKVLVGHNCFCDLLFLFQHFDDPLPNKLLEFKKNYNNTFVNVYDTKVIAEHETLIDKLENKTSLSDMFNKIRAQEKTDFVTPSFRPIYGNSKAQPYESLKQYHQAGFDAYMTGYCFLKMKEYWTTIDKKGFIERFKNKVYIYKSLYVLNMSNNEDDLSFREQSRLWYFKISSEDKPGKKPGYTDIKRILKLSEEFTVRWNSDEDFFVYMGTNDSADYLSGAKKPESKWIYESFSNWEERIKRIVNENAKIEFY